MSYTARIEKELCISSGKCLGEAPGNFCFDDEELGEAVPGAPPLADDRMLAIARNCPGGAIALFDEHGKEVQV